MTIPKPTTNDPTYERCDQIYHLRANHEPTRYCDLCAHIMVEAERQRADAAERERDELHEVVGKWARVGHPIMDAIEGTPLGSMGTDPEPFVRRIKELKSAERERDELAAWKEQAMKVMPDFQAIGRELGLSLGADVSPEILPGIIRLRNERDELRKLLESFGKRKQFPELCFCDTLDGTWCIGQQRCKDINAALAKGQSQ